MGKQSNNCRPFQKKPDDQKNDHLELDRNPAAHWHAAVKKLSGDTLIRVSLINQHERDKDKAVAGERHCKGAHATSFYYKKSENRMYQLPAAWVNMYTVKQWVDANGGKPWSMDTGAFFGTLSKIFQTGLKCEQKWIAFKQIFMPPVGHLTPTDFSAWAIPPIFAKLEGHAQITQSTTCQNPDNEWYTEPNKAFKSPYWRDIIFLHRPLPDAKCAEMVEKIQGKATKGSKAGCKTALIEESGIDAHSMRFRKKQPCGKGADGHEEHDEASDGNDAEESAINKHHAHSAHQHHSHHPRHARIRNGDEASAQAEDRGASDLSGSTDHSNIGTLRA